MIFKAYFYYKPYNRCVTIEIPAVDRFEALNKLDYMLETGHKVIPEGWDTWIIPALNCSDAYDYLP